MNEPVVDEKFPFYQNNLEKVESETICLRLMGTLNYENIIQSNLKRNFRKYE